MKLFNRIQSLLEGRLRDRNLLVVYDTTEKKLFRAPAASLMDSDKVIFLDAGESSIEARKVAGKAIRDGLRTGVVIYVPHKAPETDEERMADPYAVFSAIGRTFPETPADRYIEICKHYLKKFADDVQKLFDQFGGEPTFEMVDRLKGGGAKWAVLRSVSQMMSEAEILQWILEKASEEQIAEVRPDLCDYAHEVLDLNVPDSADGSVIREMIWARALLSEYVFGFGTDEASRPSCLKGIETSPIEADHVVCQVMKHLRDSRNNEGYREHADAVSVKANLEQITANEERLSGRGTFRFEERRLLARAMTAAKEGRIDDVRSALAQTEENAWRALDTASDQWELLAKVVVLFDTEKAVNDELGSRKWPLSSLLEAYGVNFWRFDRDARSFSTYVEDVRKAIIGEGDSTLETLIDDMVCCRFESYRKTSERMQKLFVNAVADAGWPVTGIADNARIFDDSVAPLLRQDANAVVVIIVDALRYEVGKVLAETLKSYQPEIHPACARFPTVTSVGKATLLPGGAGLQLVASPEGNRFVPMLNGIAVENINDRMGILKAQYGERFKHMTTAEFLEKKKLPFEKVNLLVLRYDDIDDILEKGKDSLLGSVQVAVAHLRSVVERIRQKGKFTDVFIVTDHGFVLNHMPTAGDKCPMPAILSGGLRVSTHDRMVLGDLEPDPSNEVLDSGTLGISGTFRSVAFPKALCAYSDGKKYFHGGVSLQEAVVPVIAFKIKNAESDPKAKALWQLKLTPKRPVFNSLIVRVNAEIVQSALFANEAETHQVVIEILRDGGNEKVPIGKMLDNDTELFTIVEGESDVIKIRLDEFNEDRITVVVRALDPISRTRLDETRFEVEIVK